MKKFILRGALALLSFSAVVTPSCIECEDVTALCDLVISAFTAPVEVTVGQAFDVISKIQNDEAGGDCTTTEIAEATVNLLEVFLSDGQGNWSLVGTKDNIAQQSISPGSLANLLQNLSLNAAGDYRLDYYDDNVNGVSERNEGNNYDNLYTGGRGDLKAAMQGTNNHASLYIKVLPLPDGTDRIKDKPTVEFH